MIGLTIYVRGVWLPFDSVTINNFFELKDEDSKDYRALYRAPDYDLIFKKMTK